MYGYWILNRYFECHYKNGVCENFSPNQSTALEICAWRMMSCYIFHTFKSLCIGANEIVYDNRSIGPLSHDTVRSRYIAVIFLYMTNEKHPWTNRNRISLSDNLGHTAGKNVWTIKNVRNYDFISISRWIATIYHRSLKYKWANPKYFKDVWRQLRRKMEFDIFFLLL